MLKLAPGTENQLWVLSNGQEVSLPWYVNRNCHPPTHDLLGVTGASKDQGVGVGGWS